MGEKMPQFERPEPVIVGPATSEKKEEYKQLIRSRFGECHYEQIPEDKRKILESLEYEKKPYEKLAIEQANEITNSIIDEFGLATFDVPERNIHIVPEKLYKQVEEDGDRVATTFQDRQLIVLNAERLIHPIDRASTILHEIIHLKNYLAIEAHEDLHKPYRSGLKISASRKKEERIGFFTAFSGLNEAVVSEIEKRYLQQLIHDNQFLADEYQWEISKEAQEFKEKIAKEKGMEADEIMWISKDGKDFNRLPYYEQRKVLNYIVDNLYKDNADKFNSRYEIMKLFFKSHFDGKLLSIARLIKKSFGNEAFRMVGMMNDEKNSARLVMDYLTKHRRKNK
ncbi:MAG TPA: hypothetical protein VNK70_01110 [Candidatus Paceibacterota bacterium]|nr:hypothetical protein [Candidatus Paceibacterota bacterium]